MKSSIFMKSRIQIARVLVLMAFLGGVHAENGCPPGQVPYSGTSVSSCGPIPGYNQQKSLSESAIQPRWESRWGAIATDGARGVLGATSNMPNKPGAQEGAMKDCKARGGEQCEIDVSYDNRCVAMSVGDAGYSIKTGRTLDEAVKNTTKACNAVDKNCHVYYTNCSPAVRIQ